MSVTNPREKKRERWLKMAQDDLRVLIVFNIMQVINKVYCFTE
jgi:hypothetical protein